MKKSLIFFIAAVLLVAVSFMLISKNIKSWEIRFKKVLNDIKENSIRNHDWNAESWNQYFENQLKQLPIYTKSSFYKSIKNALKDLDDNHSFLLLQQNNGQSCEAQSDKKDYSITIQDGIGIIYMPPIKEEINQESFLNEEWVKSFHNDLEKNKKQVTKGWIIDLTKNVGGNMYPMIAALSYFYNKKEIGGFYAFGPNGEHVKTKITFDGQSFLFNNEIGLQYKTKFPIGQNTLPVVVLIDNLTSSSAEFLALVLQRQNKVTLMGQPTFGIATGNAVMPLPDNLGHYMLTVCYYLDSNDQPLLSKKVSPQIVIDDQEKMVVESKNYISNNQPKH